MKKVLRIVGVIVGVLVLAVAGFFGWASYASSAKLSATYEVHDVDIPVPFPLTEAELDELRRERTAAMAPSAPEPDPEAGADEGQDEELEGENPEEAPEAAGPEPEPVDPLQGVDLEALALERAVSRGEHLVRSRYACVECHGDNFGGGVMVDDPAMGSLLGPNITMGEGSVTREYTISDWDHIVRHGVLPSGHPAAMPSEDFVRMSDRELSDIVAYIRSQEPVNNRVPRSTLGPVGKILMATGKLPLSADRVEDHHAIHIVEPPDTAPTAEFGQHLAAICTGCHRPTLEGGPIAAGPPDWLPASNLTPHEQGLATWEFEDFDRLMRQGRRPDGSAVADPMSRMVAYGERMTEIEMRALWTYLRSLQALDTGT